MKIKIIAIVMIGLFFSCKHKKNDSIVSEYPTEDTTNAAPSFFPVTGFIEGQIAELKNSNKKITAYLSKANKTDSMPLLPKIWDSVFADFHLPNIDSATLSKYFKETKFEDQTLEAITLSYDAKETLPNDILWKHWDIYINPETNEVERIYMVKSLPNNTTLQLTWIPGNSCKKTFITEGDTTNKMMVSEATYQWK